MSIIIKLIKLPIRAYQLVISPLIGVNCRFTPHCSHYAIEAINAHGAGKGILLTCKRLLRCHPFAKAGFDPIPPSKTININSKTKV